MLAVKKPFGYGTLSLVLLFAGFFINAELGNGTMLSRSFFQAVGLALYSKGTEGFHYPFLVSVPFWIAALWVGRRYASDFGAAVGYRLGQLMVALSVVVVVLFLILPV